jgi:hypothetical protein
MLTIENFQRLKGKVISDTGYYVHDIRPLVGIDLETHQKRHWYMIELTNRKQIVMVDLDRNGWTAGDGLKLYEMKLGKHYINLNKYQLRNVDSLVYKIYQLVLEQ